LFYVIIPPLFLYFLLFCYPYILLHFKCFFITCYICTVDTDITHTMQYKLQTELKLHGMISYHLIQNTTFGGCLNCKFMSHKRTHSLNIKTYLDNKARTEDVQWPENGYHAQAITEPSERVTSHTAVLHYKQTQ